jgi:hypothetical protein
MRVHRVLFVAAATIAACAQAQSPPALPSAEQTDPAKLGWMVGSPH